MTIKDLSAQTGYSVGTVSRVLNNQPNVSEKARKVILEAADKSGFQLNANAKQLKQQHSNTILIVVRGTSNELFGSLVEAVQSRMASEPQSLVVDYLDEEGNEVLRALQLCREKKPLGILFLGGNRDHFLADFDKINVPSVLVTNDAAGLSFPNLSSVSSDNVQAARIAIDHLVALGHRKFVVIGGERENSDTTELRFQGCMEAFRRHGIEFDEQLDYEGVRFSFAGGYQGVKKLLERGRDFSVIFAMADIMAIGAIRALRDAGLRVPEDVSVMGFDGLQIGAYTVPTLTTVRQSVEDLASRSVSILLENIESTQTPRYETVPVTVVSRESAKKLS